VKLPEIHAFRIVAVRLTQPPDRHSALHGVYLVKRPCAAFTALESDWNFTLNFFGSDDRRANEIRQVATYIFDQDTLATVLNMIQAELSTVLGFKYNRVAADFSDNARQRQPNQSTYAVFAHPATS
jgi:hypothetical protein